MHPALWWHLHGRGAPKLQAIAKAVLGMWSTTSPCERNWATHDFVHTKRRNRLTSESVEKLVFIHWNLQLLSASRKPEGRYIDIWADQLEDPPVGVDDGDVVPDDVDMDKWEAAARANRHKEGRDRIGAERGLEDEEADMSLWQDDAWMHREMMEQAQAERNKGKTIVEDQHDVFDEWATLNPHGDLDTYVDGSFNSVRTLRERVGGHVDLEALLQRDDDVEERERFYEEIPMAEEGAQPLADQRAEQLVRESMAAIVEQRAKQRVQSSADCRVSLRVEHRVDYRIERRVDMTVHQVVEQTTSDRPRFRVDDKMGESVVQDRGGMTQGSFYGIPPLPTLPARVLDDLDPQTRSVRTPSRPIVVDSGSTGVGGVVDSYSTRGRPGQPPPSQDVHTLHASRAASSSFVQRCTRMRSSSTSHTLASSPLGIPLLPPRRPGAIMDNVKTSRANRKRKLSEDDGATTPVTKKKAVGPQGGATHGVRTHSRVAEDSTSKHSSRIVDDDPDEENDALSSDGMSDSDYEEETRLRGVDEVVSYDTLESADDAAE
ncbi:hypothetical protein CBR_g8187 [Chara braunii]|uniref:HAT C-terminal dimerisation domain-containing protein n=1 Tax=Chara braunii TaxID=69332 RepID=A0A388KLH3_CHABU|nr:hypothetical protein CBR_g8187 [Chara braunii]|eukprot:GBG70887.1 hypothetical protein CBR_g8187 [Chara braunii]